MGYTNYWNASEPVSLEQAAPHLQELLQIGTEQGILAGADGLGTAVFDGRIVVFNGSTREAYESFYITPDQTGFQFCKTARKPYDAFVKAALILIQASCDDPEQFRISCDGSHSDWEQAAELVEKVSNIKLCDVIISDSVLSTAQLRSLTSSVGM